MRIATTLPGARQSTTATISKILSRDCQPRWNLANGAVLLFLRPVSAIRCLSPSVSPRRYKSRTRGYIDAGFYNRVTNDEKTETHDEELIALYNARNIPLFMEKCVEYGKTLAVAGETGSGKTTFMKMLIQYIPVHLRITTIEDNPEIIFFKHKELRSPVLSF